MGYSYISYKRNNLDFNKVKKYYKVELVKDASHEFLFDKLPDFNMVKDIEVSDMGDNMIIYFDDTKHSLLFRKWVNIEAKNLSEILG